MQFTGRLLTQAVRFDWDDAEAEAAGWRRPIAGFPWRDTVRHMGRLVIGVSAGGGHTTFDLREVAVETAFDR